MCRCSAADTDLIHFSTSSRRLLEIFPIEKYKCVTIFFSLPLYIFFSFWTGRSLKHLKSNKCIHTYGAWPGVDRHMVLWSGCDEKRLEIWFAKQGI